jgi:hypothetical protein
VRAPPICSAPVGEGAKRVTTGWSDMGADMDEINLLITVAA